MYLATPQTRKVVLGFVFFILFWIIYDSMRVYPNYEFNPVHLETPYELEKSLFGILYDGNILTPNEYFKVNTNSFFDFMSGIFYLSWVPVPMAFALYLFFKDRKHMLRFTMVFLLTNLIGFVIYYSYPAAPPWYVEQYGFIENFNIPGDAAQLINFDNLVGIPIFENMYNKNANVFAAIPSLHAAYPVVTLYFAVKKRYKLLTILFSIMVIGIWFAAVYSFHHYFIDVILGVFCAIFAIFAFEFLIKNSFLDKALVKYNNFIG
jgi:hypothetical protein